MEQETQHQGKGVNIWIDPDLALNCISIYSAGVGQIGLRNNCDVCMAAVVDWQFDIGIKYHNVPAYNQIVIKPLSVSMKLIGEQPCK